MAKKAPGKAHRKGVTLAELFQKFPDDATAEKWFAEQRWGGKPACPHCGSTNVQSGAKHKTMPYRCREKQCAKRFSVKTGTAMRDSNLGYQTWAIAIYLLVPSSLKGVSSMKLHRDLGITQKSAWHLAHRIRTTFDLDKPPAMSGPVEVDEAFFGGREANKHQSKKLRQGRGGVGKTAVVGAKDRDSNRVSAQVVESTDAATLVSFVEARAVRGATVYTDEARVYEPLPKILNRYTHESVKHSVGEYVRGMAHTNGIESFWSMLKRGYFGIYHKMSPKHLNRYVTEFVGRHNMRESDTLAQMKMVTRGLERKRLRYRELIADNGLDSGARA